MEYSLGGINFSLFDLQSQSNLELISQFPTGHVHFVNAAVLAEFRKSRQLRLILSESRSVNLIDSRPFSLIVSRNNHNKKYPQVRGVDFMRIILDGDYSRRYRHTFVGNTNSTLELLERKMKLLGISAEYEELPFADWYEFDLDAIASRALTYDPDFIWISLGTPKQDFVAYEIWKKTGIRTLCIGAALDFYLDPSKEAPKILQKMGGEWIFRLIKEPKRLWRRYLFGNFKAILQILWPIK